MTTLTKIGTAYIDVDADLSPFWRKVNSELNTGGQFKSAGKAAGKAFSDGLAASDKDVRRAVQNVNAFGRDGTASFKSVGTSARAANADLRRLYKDVTAQNISRALVTTGVAGKRAGTEIEAGVKRGSAGLRTLNRDANRTAKGFEGLVAAMGGGGGITRAARALDGLGGSFTGGVAAIGGLRIALTLVVPALIAFSGAAVAATSALAPLIGMAAAAGNAIASAAQGFGVFKLATAGIGAALKEQIDNQTRAGAAAAENAGQQRAAARAIQSAQDQLRSSLEGVGDAEDDLTDAHKDARKAQRDLTRTRSEARRALTDMRDALVDAGLSERRALLDLRDAQQALAQIATGAAQDELSDASRAATEAIHGQRQAVLSLLKAQESLDELMGRAANAEQRRAGAIAALTRAQENLRRLEADANATYADRTDALTLVADATREVNAANAASTTSELDKAQALQDVVSAQDGVAASQANAIATQKALQALAAGASDQERAKALLDVLEAQQRLVEAERDRARAQRDTAAADRVGIEGSAAVVAAKEAIAQADDRIQAAERAVRDAHTDVTRATQALSDAQLSAREQMVKSAAATANLHEKMQSLPPAAQAFVRQLIAMKPRLDELRATASNGFFPGATAGLQAATGSFKSVNKVVGETSTVLGEAARKSGELVGSPAFGKDIETIGGRNAVVLDTLGEALRHVISAFRHVLVAAGPLTQWLADVANKWALNAAQAAKAGRESGKMAEFFEKTRAVAQRLGSIIGHLTHGLFGVGKAGTKTGNDIWASIDRAAKRFDKWANSAKGQTQLHEFFTRTKELAAAIVKPLGNVTAAVAVLTVKTLPLTEALKLLGPYADEATVAFIAFKLAGLGVAAASRILGVTMAVATFATGGWTTAFWALNAAMVANPIGVIVVALAAVAAALFVAWTRSETFRDVLTAVWNAIKTVVSAAAKEVASVVVAAWNAIKTATSTVWNAITSVLRTVWNAIKAVASTIFNAIKSVIDGVWNGIKTVATTVWNGIKAVATTVWNGIKLAITKPISLALDVVTDIWDRLKRSAEKAWGLITKGVTAFADGVKDTVVRAFRGAAKIVGGFVNSIIWVINKIPGIPNIDKIDVGKLLGEEPDKKARGGAYARTGGIVDQPITLMGEEAPRHREWVIPENPAYRKRAQMLLGQAAQSIGLARGGIYSQTDMERLWAKHGGGDTKIAGAVGMAESGGNANAANGPYHGLWQVGPGGPFDPDENAKAAIAKWRAGGDNVDARWRPWEAYTGPDGTGSDGPWRQFASGGGGGGGGILGKIKGVVGDLLSSGAKFLLDKLPGIGDFPDWLRGTGSWILKHATDWIKDKVNGLIGGGEGGVSGSGGGVMTGTNAKAAKLAKMFHARITSGYRTPEQNAAAGGVPGSSHMKGSPGNPGAHDFVPAQTALLNEALRMGAKWVDNHDFGSGMHSHVSWFRQGGLYPHRGSFAQGGIVGGPTGAPATITAHGGEAVVPSGGDLVGALREHSAELRALRQAGVSGVMASITDHVMQRGGEESQRRSMTAGSPAITAIYG